MDGRTYSTGFADRTRKNLDFIECARANGADVHEVTQIVNSLLGLVVIPYGRRDLATKTNAKASTSEWKIIRPHWKEDGVTLENIVRHLRNGAAHGDVMFSGEDRDPAKTTITFTDRDSDFGDPSWIAEIRGDKLRDFCARLSDLIQGAQSRV